MGYGVGKAARGTLATGALTGNAVLGEQVSDTSLSVVAQACESIPGSGQRPRRRGNLRLPSTEPAIAIHAQFTFRPNVIWRTAVINERNRT
jgi:hypothetical protein